MTGRLEGKVALITGAAGGIGSVTARRFREEGAAVALLDVAEKSDTLGGLAAELDSLPVTADVRAADQVDRAVAAVVERLGGLDVVFANAGVLCRGSLTDTLETQQAMWDQALAVNVTGTWNTLRTVAPYLQRAGRGSIIVTSSVAGIRAGLNNAAYSATKHAVIGLAKTAAHELGRYGVRVNCVLPTGVYTPMFIREERIQQARPDLANPTLDDAIATWSRTNLLGVPWIEAVDVANAVVFLASDEARYITGVSLLVDAGQTQINPFTVAEASIPHTPPSGGSNHD
jgi:(+)-trans-carveol dehydrogenase